MVLLTNYSRNAILRPMASSALVQWFSGHRCVAEFAKHGNSTILCLELKHPVVGKDKAEMKTVGKI